MNLSIDHRETLRRWMPMLLAALGAWLLLRGARRVLWTAFGMAWVFWWSVAADAWPLRGQSCRDSDNPRRCAACSLPRAAL